MTQSERAIPVKLASELVRQRVLAVLGGTTAPIKTAEITDAILGANYFQVKYHLDNLLGEGKVTKMMESRRAGAQWKLTPEKLSQTEAADTRLPLKSPSFSKKSKRQDPTLHDRLANRIPLRVEILRNMIESRGVGHEYCETDFPDIKERLHDLTSEIDGVLDALPASDLKNTKKLVKGLFAPITGVEPPLARVVSRIQKIGRDAIMKWGSPAQKFMIFEEVAELQRELGRFQQVLSEYQKQVCKVERAEKPDTTEIKDAIIDDLADNLIMIVQSTEIFQLDLGRVFTTIDAKLDRLKKKLREEAS